MHAASPTLVMAVLGQARFDGRLDPERETAVISRILGYWAAQRFVGVRAPDLRTPGPARAIPFAHEEGTLS